MTKKLTKKKLNKAIKKLNVLYDKIPDTKGCMENINKEGGCGAWCCQFQNPSVLYSEFRNTWNFMIQNWEIEDLISLVRKSIQNYLSDKLVKGCIFFDHKTRMCTQHETRPYNCRIYGITPDDEFKPRYERLKVIYENKGEELRDQCDLVETVKDKKVTKKHIDKWWEELKEAEKEIGFKESDINDADGGSYRTYHDHLLLHLFPEDVLRALTFVKTNGTPIEKIEAIEKFTEVFREIMINAVKSKDT